MSQPIAPHILVVTQPTEAGVIDLTYSIECPGVTDHCRSNVLCEKPDCDADEGDDIDVVAHGLRHVWVDDHDGWYIPTDRCHLVDHDSLADVADSLGLPPGRHPVRWYFGHGYDLELRVLAEVKP